MLFQFIQSFLLCQTFLAFPLECGKWFLPTSCTYLLKWLSNAASAELPTNQFWELTKCYKNIVNWTWNLILSMFDVTTKLEIFTMHQWLDDDDNNAHQAISNERENNCDTWCHLRMLLSQDYLNLDQQLNQIRLDGKDCWGKTAQSWKHLEEHSTPSLFNKRGESSLMGVLYQWVGSRAFLLKMFTH